MRRVKVVFLIGDTGHVTNLTEIVGEFQTAQTSRFQYTTLFSGYLMIPVDHAAFNFGMVGDFMG